ncbi:MAG: VWA domain-containing protein [Myxococcales bacterium]|nr:MAG: VWA domain-containing protein [Myxococcales bacterium]
MPRALAALGLLLAWSALAGCSDGRRYDQAVGVLIDVSGTYADERQETVRVVKREILPQMVPGDTLLVASIDSESYDRENVLALLTLDRRPSHANAQKLEMARLLDAFATRPTRSAHTDIPGAIMLASEYLGETGAGSRVLLIFSDMQEDLPVGSRRQLDADELAGTRVVALNVKRLGRDQADPALFRGRLEGWGERVAAAGAAEWRTLLDPTKLPEYLEAAR